QHVAAEDQVESAGGLSVDCRRPVLRKVELREGDVPSELRPQFELPCRSSDEACVAQAPGGGAEGPFRVNTSLCPAQVGGIHIGTEDADVPLAQFGELAIEQDRKRVG